MRVLLIRFIDQPACPDVEFVLEQLKSASFPLSVSSEDWHEMRRQQVVSIARELRKPEHDCFVRELHLPDIDRAATISGLTKGIEFESAAGTRLSGTLSRKGVLLGGCGADVPDDDGQIVQLIDFLTKLGIVASVEKLSRRA